MFFLLVGFWEADARSVTGEEGHSVTIQCSHSNAFSNVKYFCKAPCSSEDVLIKSTGSDQHSHKKYKIKDGGNVFNVTISALDMDDSGDYWCGIERVGVDTYSKITLTVVRGRSVYIGAGLGKEKGPVHQTLSQDSSVQHRNHTEAQPGIVDSTITSEPSSGPGDVFYSTISFINGSDSAAVPAQAKTATYSALRHTSTVYSNL
ncbi:unnamed protein product [Menidia menidia]|uniref:(Atlantic silverside) hypothetical protein n=1 Tax=Menidia menidia TaxID=238744 RepID=A0A8S4B6J5_9TELE|nr:unnamed protein product [Menidia menidia]